MTSFELSRPLFVNSFRHIDSNNCVVGWVSSNCVVPKVQILESLK